MIKKNHPQIEIQGKIIYKAENPNDWAIAIMPDGVLIKKSHHKHPYIHPNPDKHHINEKIKDNPPEKICQIISSHIEINESLNLKTLIKELKK